MCTCAVWICYDGSGGGDYGNGFVWHCQVELIRSSSCLSFWRIALIIIITNFNGFTSHLVSEATFVSICMYVCMYSVFGSLFIVTLESNWWSSQVSHHFTTCCSTYQRLPSRVIYNGEIGFDSKFNLTVYLPTTIGSAYTVIHAHIYTNIYIYMYIHIHSVKFGSVIGCCFT